MVRIDMKTRRMVKSDTKTHLKAGRMRGPVMVSGPGRVREVGSGERDGPGEPTEAR
jgi:hypothetical protein